MCSTFHTIPSRHLRKMFFLPLVLHIRPDCPHPALRSLLTFYLCYSLSPTMCLGSYPCPKRCSRSFSPSSPCALLGFLSHLQWKSNLALPPEAPCQNKANKHSLYPCCAAAGFLKEHYTLYMMNKQNGYIVQLRGNSLQGPASILSFSSVSVLFSVCIGAYLHI